MAHFPAFFDLSGKPVLIVGDTPEARRKGQILASFGPRLRFLPGLHPEDLEPLPALVILTGENRAGDARLCREKNIPVNSADDPENCTFFFPSLLRRGDCTIAVSSGGSAPAAAAALKRQIEENLPENLEEILPWLGCLTAALRKTVPDHHRRRALLARICAEAFEKSRPLTEAELEQYM